MIKRKKGQAITLQGLISISIVIITLALILSFGAKVTDKITNTMTASETVTNESVGYLINTTNITIDRAGYSHFSLDSIIEIVNTSDGYVYNSDNYTFYSNGIVSWIDNMDPDSNTATSGKNITYTCSYCDDASCACMENGTMSLGEFSGWIPTIAIIIAAALIIGIVVTYFTVKKT